MDTTPRSTTTTDATPLRVDVTTDSGLSWASNALRFATVEQAQDYARDLYSRWTAVDAWRVVDDRDGTCLDSPRQPVTVGHVVNL
jgi:hypothetical protein